MTASRHFSDTIKALNATSYKVMHFVKTEATAVANTE